MLYDSESLKKRVNDFETWQLAYQLGLVNESSSTNSPVTDDIEKSSDKKARQIKPLKALAIAGGIGVSAIVISNALGTHQVSEDITRVINTGDTLTGVINESCSQLLPEGELNMNASLHETSVTGAVSKQELQPGNIAVIKCMANGGFITEWLND